MNGQRELDPVGPAATERADRSRRRKVVWMTLAVLVVGLLALGYVPRALRARNLASLARLRQRALPAVMVAPVKGAPADRDLALPGSIQALAETALFGRADGYVTRRLADIGDRVARGDLLAEIESPELEQQIREARATLSRVRAGLQQAEAALAQATANLHLAEVTAERWLTLAGKGVLSRQDGDEKQALLDARRADAAAAEAAVAAARETVAANEATVQRLLELQSFRQVRAPFAGVVTARSVEVGSLVSAGSSSSIRELFRLADDHILRVFVNVPQSDANLIVPGLSCEVEVPERAGDTFTGSVTRTAHALDPVSRTLLTEVHIVNTRASLVPGLYATVLIKVHRARPPVLVPSAAVRNTDKGPVVAVLRDGATVHLQPVRLGRDDGAQMEVVEGLKAGQTLITSWTDDVKEGARVQPVKSAKPGPGGKGQ